MFEYLSQVQSAVRRINDRMKAIAEHMGTDSKYYQNYQSKIDILLPFNNRYKDGVIGLYNPKEIFTNIDNNINIERLDKELKSWGELKKEYRQGYKEYEKGYQKYHERQVRAGLTDKDIKSKMPLETYIENMQNLSDALAYLYSVEGTDGKSNAIKSRQKKATEQLNKMRKKNKRKYATINQTIRVANELKNEINTEYWQP